MYFAVMLFVTGVLLCMSCQPHFGIRRCGWSIIAAPQLITVVSRINASPTRPSSEVRKSSRRATSIHFRDKVYLQFPISHIPAAMAANFFNNKARAAAAAASSSTKQKPTDPREEQLQPWVEK